MESIETISKAQHDEEIRQLKEKYKPNNAFNVPVTDTLDFFKRWCAFLRQFISLTGREIDVVASLLNQRWKLFKYKDIKDPSVLDTLTMSSDTFDKVTKECKMTKQHFHVVMNSLRKKGVINGHINPKLIPNMKDDGTFKLTIIFSNSSQE